MFKNKSAWPHFNPDAPMMYDTVFMVSVEWLLTNLITGVDGFDFERDGFQAMIYDKSADEDFPVLLERIMDEGFKVPICVQDHQAIGFRQGNGHHRLAAAILLCLDEIPVIFSDDDDYMRFGSTGAETLGYDIKVYKAWEPLLSTMY